MNNDTMELVKSVQVEMLAAGGDFIADESSREDLRVMIRVTIETHDYLKHGSAGLARSIYDSPGTNLLDGMMPGYKDRLKAASEDPFNQYDLNYACETILSGVDCFERMSPFHPTWTSTLTSSVDWRIFASREEFNSRFFALFGQFLAESDFQKKFRLLHDLFKLQLAFVAMSYER